MTVPFRPHGAWTALVTPFQTTGQFDVGGYRRLIDFQVDQGVDGIVPCGTTGESPTLSWKEHDVVNDAAIHAADGRFGVLAGTGSNNTAEAVRGTMHAKEIGASAALLVDCYYNAPSSLELRTEYYECILAEVPDIPIVPYVIPARSGCALSAADLAMLHLGDPKRVPAVKQATGDLDRMREDRTLSGPGLGILSGDDEITLDMMRDPEVRAPGVVSVMANLAPAAMSQMVRAQQRGDNEEADRLRHVLSPILSLVGCAVKSVRDLPNGQRVDVTDKFRNPVPVKAMMAGLGMLGPTVRRPLGRMNQRAITICRDALRKVHASDPGVLGPIEGAFDIRIDQRLSDDGIWSALCR